MGLGLDDTDTVRIEKEDDEGEITEEDIVSEVKEPQKLIDSQKKAMKRYQERIEELESKIGEAEESEDIEDTEVQSIETETNTEITPYEAPNKALDIQRELTLEGRKENIKKTMDLIEYTADEALNEDDFWEPKGSNKKALTRSGCNKLATVFRISTETLKIWIEKEQNIQGEEDIVAYAKVKATRSDGSSVISIANKALSEYGSNKPSAKDPREWVDMQTLKGTAETRASNRAIQNAIGFVPDGFSVVSKEEMNRGGGKSLFD